MLNLIESAWQSASTAEGGRFIDVRRTSSSCAACLDTNNGPEFVAKAVQEWIAAVGARTAYIAPSLENGYIESFNARLRDELLDGEIFYTLNEARIVIESWRRHYNSV